MDGVLADFDGPIFHDFRHVLDIGSIAQQRHRFLSEHITFASAGSEVDYWRTRMRKSIERHGYFYDLAPITGAEEGIQKLLDAGLDVWVCSKPLEASPSCASDKFAWLKHHFPALVGRLILSPDKSMIDGAVLIDDAPQPVEAERASWYPIVYEHPWNKGLQDLYPSMTWASMDIEMLKGLSE